MGPDKVGMSNDTPDERVIGAAIAVHKSLGPGVTEPIYHRAMVIELARRDIPFESENPQGLPKPVPFLIF